MNYCSTRDLDKHFDPKCKDRMRIEIEYENTLYLSLKPRTSPNSTFQKTCTTWYLVGFNPMNSPMTWWPYNNKIETTSYRASRLVSCEEYKYMYRYVGPVVSAIDKSDLGQFSSRKRPRSRWGPPLGARIAGRASPCSPLSTLQVPAETAFASYPCGGSFFSLLCHFT